MQRTPARILPPLLGLLATACASAGPAAAPAPSPGREAGAAASGAPASSSTATSRGAAALPPFDPAAAPAMRAEVRGAFLHAWDGYRRYAWGHDEVRPLSDSTRDWYGEPVLMTPIDAYDTMLLIGLDAEAADAKRLILDRLSFDRDTSVQVFEVTIRLVGGLLSAYEMDGDPRFLAFAADLGERLLPAFDSPTGMPYRFVNLRTGAVRDSASNPAEIGSLMLEFGTLARSTGRREFYDVAKRAVAALFQRRSKIGLVGERIDVRTGEWLSSESHVGGYIDSYYEYLYKSWLLFGDDDFRAMWDASIGPVNRYLADTHDGRLWYGHADMESGKRTATRFGALDAFLPGLLALSGDTARAARLMASVYRMWSTFDVEPEVMDYESMTVVEGAYPLRPEALESAFYLWRTTGEERWRAMGKDIFERIVRWTRTPTAFAGLADVRTKEKRDRMHSFLLAETFKYAWLLFAPDSVLGLDDVVFNTEAHPLRRPRKRRPAGAPRR